MQNMNTMHITYTFRIELNSSSAFAYSHHTMINKHHTNRIELLLRYKLLISNDHYPKYLFHYYLLSIHHNS